MFEQLIAPFVEQIKPELEKFISDAAAMRADIADVKAKFEDSRVAELRQQVEDAHAKLDIILAHLETLAAGRELK